MYDGLISERSSDIESIIGKGVYLKENLIRYSMTSEMMNSEAMREGAEGDSLLFGAGGIILKNNVI